MYCACLLTCDRKMYSLSHPELNQPQACPIWMQIASRMAMNWRELLHKRVSCRKHTVRWGTPQAQILEPKGIKQHHRISSEATTFSQDSPHRHSPFQKWAANKQPSIKKTKDHRQRNQGWLRSLNTSGE